MQAARRYQNNYRMEKKEEGKKEQGAYISSSGFEEKIELTRKITDRTADILDGFTALAFHDIIGLNTHGKKRYKYGKR